ncbi:MAG: type IV pilus biogenesis protein PilM [Planctomycetota bacterium]
MARQKTKQIDKRFAAVDFDARQLRIVEAERVGRNIRIGRTAAIDVPETVDPSDAGSMGPFLGEILAQMKLKKSSLVMTVSRADVVFKPLTLPPGTAEEEMAGMVQFQMQSELPYRIEEAVIDFTIETHYDATAGTSETEAGIDVLVAAVKLPVVDHYRQVANLAGAKLVRLGLRPYANRRCLEACVERRGEEVLGLLHITAEAAEINVIDHASLAFSRSAVISLPPSGQTDPDQKKRAINSVTLEAARSLRSYSALEGGKRIDRLFVAGSTGIEQTLAEELGKRLNVPAELLDPQEAMKLRETDGMTHPSGFVTALGLAISSAGASLPFDFLNPKRPAIKLDKKRPALLAAVAAVVLLVGGYWAFNKYMIQPRETRILQLQAALAREKHVAAAREADEEYADTLASWIRQRGNPLVHGNHIAGLLPGPTELVLEDLEFGEKTRDRTWYASVQFRAKAPSQMILLGLRTKLETAGYTVEFETITPDPKDPQYGHYVDVTVLYRPGMEIDLAKVTPAARPADEIPLAERGYQKK